MARAVTGGATGAPTLRVLTLAMAAVAVALVLLQADTASGQTAPNPGKPTGLVVNLADPNRLYNSPTDVKLESNTKRFMADRGDGASQGPGHNFMANAIGDQVDSEAASGRRAREDNTATTYRGTTEQATDTRSYRVSAINAAGAGEPSEAGAASVSAASPPPAPAAPTVASISGSKHRLTVTWTAPDNPGNPAITSYDLQYRAGSSGSFTQGPEGVTGLTSEIGGLASNTTYQVQVRAVNSEGGGAWSSSGSATTNANNAPTFSPATYTRSLMENTGAGEDIGAAIVATDTDSEDTLTYRLGGTDASAFEIDSATGQIRTKSGVAYDFEAKSSYSVDVIASDGDGGEVSAAVTITVLDVLEPPAAPERLSVEIESGVHAQLSVSWRAPNNAGKPPITSYDLRYKQDGDSDWTEGPQDVTTTSTTVSSLNGGELYEVQVRATNDEGDGPWSGTGCRSTSAETPVQLSSVALISNMSQPDGSMTTLDYAFGQGFTTGKSCFGYRVNRIDLMLGDLGSDPSDIAVSVYRWRPHPTNPLLGASRPGTRIKTFRSAVPLKANTLNTWTTSGITLAPNTSYTVVVHGRRDGETDSVFRSKNFNRGGGSPNWQLFSDSDYTSFPVGSWPWFSWGRQIKVSLWGYARGYDQNREPLFNSEHYSVSIDEDDSGVTDLGDYTATDGDGDTLTYTLSGPDADSFELDATTGRLRDKSGVSYNYETQSSFLVIINAWDGKDISTAPVAINVNDLTEPPSRPSAPTVAAVANSTRLSASWSSPTNIGPEITGYDLRYREDGGTTWYDGPQDVTATTAFIDSLQAATTYHVQVRATNDEGDSDWSPGTSATTASTANAPTFAGTMLTRSMPENLAAGQNVGAAVTATDADSSTLNYTLGGVDADYFTIVAGTGQIRTKSGVTYDYESGRTQYTVVVTATDQTSTADATVRISVTDADEPPAAPPVLKAIPPDETSVVVSWEAPANEGKPDITSYDLRYRHMGAWVDVVQAENVTSTTVTGLTARTQYEFQARATNEEGDGEWSASRFAIPATSMISNIGQENGGEFPLAYNYTHEFTTGVASLGFTLTGVDLKLATVGRGVPQSIYIHTPGHRGRPGPKVGSLDLAPGTEESNSVASWTTTGIHLEGGTTYQLVVRGISGWTPGTSRSTSSLRYTNSDNVDAGASTGWGLDRRVYDSMSIYTATTLWRPDPGAIMMAIKANANVPSEGAPSAPSGFTATVDGRFDVDLAWTAPADVGDSPVSGYRIEYSTNGSKYSVVEADTGDTATTYTHTTVSRSRTLYYRVFALNDQGSSIGSQPAMITRTPNRAPIHNNGWWLAGTRVTPEGVSGGHHAGAPVIFNDPDGDTVTYSISGPDRWAFGVEPTTGQIITRPNITYDFEWRFQYMVRITGTDPYGASSSVMVFVMVSDVIEAPTVMPAPRITGKSSTSLTITWPHWWNRPDGLDRFLIQYRKQGDSDWRNVRAKPTGEKGRELTPFPYLVRYKPHTLYSLSADTTYEIRTSARAELGTGDWSAITTVATAAQSSPGNNPAAGSPSISGAASVGLTLTAATGAISDADGMERVTFTYSWLADDEAIDGATGSSYVLTDAEIGKGVAVKVSFTDDEGFAESVTSDSTSEVSARTDLQAQSAAVDGGALTLTYNEILDVSPTVPTDAFAVLVNGTSRGVSAVSIGGSSVTLTLTPPVVGDDTVTVSYSRPNSSNFIRDTLGRIAPTFTHLAVTNNSPASTNSPATGTPTVSGTARVGETLTASTSAISDADGLDDATFGYQWLRVSADGTETDVSGATASTYTLASADASRTVKVRVSFTDDAGNAESLTGTATGTVARPLLTASVSEVPASHDGSSTFTFELRFSEELSLSYVTLRDGAFTATGGEVAGARRLTQGSNVGWEITVEPSGNDVVTLVLPPTTDCEAAGAICTGDGRKLSSRVEVSVPGPSGQQDSQENRPATGSPTISGTARVGETLTASTSGIADADGLDDATFTYRWLADAAAISGATGSTYTLASADQGKTVKVRVSFTDDAGNAESLTSAATEAVTVANRPATGSPTISGTVRVGETLTASTSGIADEDGLANATFSYQWLADDAEISGATGSTYELASGDQGKGIKVRVSFTDDAGNAESLTSAATAAVARPLLTASASNIPASHDGSSSFTFELRFSEEFSLSYVTLRDHAFMVTGGTIENARRLTQGSNVGWEITVEPSGNGTVTVGLPPTTDCAATGAICTQDGRKLSSRVEVTVVGPSQ